MGAREPRRRTSVEPRADFRLELMNGTLGLLLVALSGELFFSLLGPGPAVRGLFIPVAGVTVMVGWCWRARHWPLRRRVLGVVAPVLPAVYLLTMHSGFLPNVSIAVAVIGALLSLWFGPRAALSFLAALALVLLVGGYQLSVDRPPLNRELVDPYRLQNWLRVALNFFTFASALAILVHWVVEQVERAGREREEAYGLLRLGHRRMEQANEDERRHLSRGLKDDLGHELSRVKVGLQLATRMTPDELPAKMREAVTHLDEVIERLNHLARDLCPPLLAEAGLSGAVTALLDRHPGVEGCNLTIEVDVDDRLPVEIESAAFRLLSEALANVAVRGDGTRVSIAMRVEGGALVVSVEDDGAAFQVEPGRQGAPPGESTGLAEIRQRIVCLGGTMAVASSNGGGTVVRAELPDRPGSTVKSLDACVSGVPASATHAPSSTDAYLPTGHGLQRASPSASVHLALETTRRAPHRTATRGDESAHSPLA